MSKAQSTTIALKNGRLDCSDEGFLCEAWREAENAERVAAAVDGSVDVDGSVAAAAAPPRSGQSADQWQGVRWLGALPRVSLAKRAAC